MNVEQYTRDGWIQADTKAFWNEVAPSDHLVQIYDNEDVFINSIEGFTATGLDAGESVIIIATAEHLNGLEDRLMRRGYDVNSIISDDQYIALNAEDLLSRFMVKGIPDERLFMQSVKELVKRARSKGRNIRAFGEMVALLWTRGQREATIQLEALWNKFCETEKFCLFCAYPRNGFSHPHHDSIPHICTSHSKEIAGWGNTHSEILYKATGS